MWDSLAETVKKYPSKREGSRNSLYDILQATFAANRSELLIDIYVGNYQCYKTSMEFYINNGFVISLNYYRDCGNLSKDSHTDVVNLINLGRAYRGIDELLDANKINQEECKKRMKKVIAVVNRGLRELLKQEIKKQDFLEQLKRVQNKMGYLANLIGVDISDKDFKEKVAFLNDFIEEKETTEVNFIFLKDRDNLRKIV